MRTIDEILTDEVVAAVREIWYTKAEGLFDRVLPHESQRDSWLDHRVPRGWTATVSQTGCVTVSKPVFDEGAPFACVFRKNRDGCEACFKLAL